MHYEIMQRKCQGSAGVLSHCPLCYLLVSQDWWPSPAGSSLTPGSSCLGWGRPSKSHRNFNYCERPSRVLHSLRLPHPQHTHGGRRSLVSSGSGCPCRLLWALFLPWNTDSEFNHSASFIPLVVLARNEIESGGPVL